MRSPLWKRSYASKNAVTLFQKVATHFFNHNTKHSSGVWRNKSVRFLHIAYPLNCFFIKLVLRQYMARLKKCSTVIITQKNRYYKRIFRKCHARKQENNGENERKREHPYYKLNSFKKSVDKRYFMYYNNSCWKQSN